MSRELGCCVGSKGGMFSSTTGCPRTLPFDSKYLVSGMDMTAMLTIPGEPGESPGTACGTTGHTRSISCLLVHGVIFMTLRKYRMTQSVSHQVAKELVGKLIVVVSTVERCRTEVQVHVCVWPLHGCRLTV